MTARQYSALDVETIAIQLGAVVSTLQMARFDTKVVKTTERSLNLFNWSIIDIPD